MTSLNHTHSLSHTKWNFKYHVVFAPKYRRKVFYGSKRLEIGVILRELSSWKGVNIIEAESRSYVTRDPTQTIRIFSHGVSKREEQHHDL